MPLHDRIGSQQARARASYALQYQLTQPRPPGVVAHRGPWLLNRVPYHHYLPPFGAPVDLELTPDEIAALQAGGGAAPRPRAGGGCPLTTSYVLKQTVNAEGGAMVAVSSNALRTPCRIVGCEFLIGPTPDANGSWGLSVSPSPVNGDAQAPVGSSLFQLFQFQDPDVIDDFGTTEHTPIPFIMNGGRVITDLAQSVVGRVILESSPYLTLWTNRVTLATADSMFVVVVTVEDCDVNQQVIPRVTAPRVITQGTAAPAPAAAGTTAPRIQTTTAPAPAITPARDIQIGSVPQSIPTGTISPARMQQLLQQQQLSPAEFQELTTGVPQRSVALEPGGTTSVPAGSERPFGVAAPPPPRTFYVVPTGREAVPFYR